MALIIKTNAPADLLAAIKKEIDESNIETWTYDSDSDFTHTPDQWNKLAWFRPKIYTGELRMGILGNKGQNLKKVVYGVYHGRFIEMLLNHFDDKFTNAQATAHKTDPDNFD